MLSQMVSVPGSRGQFPRRVSSQCGAVLFVGLIILLIITLIGTSGMSTVTLEERMVSNMQNANKAFQGSEAVLSECEDFLREEDFGELDSRTSTDLADLSAGTHQILEVGTITQAQWWNDSSFWASYGVKSSANGIVNTGSNTDGLASEPRCITEYIGNGKSTLDIDSLYAGPGSEPADKLLYRVTGYSQGADVSSESVVESLYVKQ